MSLSSSIVTRINSASERAIAHNFAFYMAEAAYSAEQAGDDAAAARHYAEMDRIFAMVAAYDAYMAS